MSCSNKIDILAWVDGELSPIESQAMERHLVECAACRQEAEEVRTVVEAVAQPEAEHEGGDPWPALRSLLTRPLPLAMQIADALHVHAISTATSLITKNLNVIIDLQATQRGAAELLSVFCQWLELGFASCSATSGVTYRDLAATVIAGFPSAPRAAWSVHDCAHLRLAQGLMHLQHERYTEALKALRGIENLSVELADNAEILPVANAAIAKAFRRQGAYKEALRLQESAIAMALAANQIERAGMFRVTEAWLRFQFGEFDRALTLLDNAESVLRGTSDHFSLGNIEAARSRILTRQGYYSAALEPAHRAAAHFRVVDGCHSNLARVLVNTAHLDRLVALKITETFEAPPTEADRLRTRAALYLMEAGHIYGFQHDVRGSGSVLLAQAALNFDAGRFDVAAAEAADAYELGRTNSDKILMVRSRLQQCTAMVAVHDLSRADIPLLYAREAVVLSESTDNQHLLARSLVWLGRAYLGDRPPDVRGAQECYERVTSTLSRQLHGMARNEYTELLTELRRVGVTGEDGNGSQRLYEMGCA